jgi:hypothetical protein
MADEEERSNDDNVMENEDDSNGVTNHANDDYQATDYDLPDSICGVHKVITLNEKYHWSHRKRE